MEKQIHTHVFNLSPKTNGGEALVLTTDFFDNGDNEPLLRQKLTLNSYCNTASFNLEGTILTPKLLRKLANELEENLNKAAAKL